MSIEAMNLALESLEVECRMYEATDPETGAPYNMIQAITALRQAIEQAQKPKCNPHPNAPHGFVRSASINSDDYVCECHSWKPPESEPVAWWDEKLGVFDEKHFDQLQPLYTSPPQRQPLTDEALIECERLADIRHRKHMGSIRGQQLSPADQFLWHYARAIEAAHGIKGEA